MPGNAMHGLHRTDTVDSVICIAGEIDMFLDESRFVTLRAGDVLIQRGTDHAWVNRSDELCRLAVILLDTLPKPGLGRRPMATLMTRPGAVRNRS